MRRLCLLSDAQEHRNQVPALLTASILSSRWNSWTFRDLLHCIQFSGLCFDASWLLLSFKPPRLWEEGTRLNTRASSQIRAFEINSILRFVSLIFFLSLFCFCKKFLRQFIYAKNFIYDIYVVGVRGLYRFESQCRTGTFFWFVCLFLFCWGFFFFFFVVVCFWNYTIVAHEIETVKPCLIFILCVQPNISLLFFSGGRKIRIVGLLVRNRHISPELVYFIWADGFLCRSAEWIFV